MIFESLISLMNFLFYILQFVLSVSARGKLGFGQRSLHVSKQEEVTRCMVWGVRRMLQSSQFQSRHFFLNFFVLCIGAFSKWNIRLCAHETSFRSSPASPLRAELCHKSTRCDMVHPSSIISIAKLPLSLKNTVRMIFL
jgi:hypothetical protein